VFSVSPAELLTIAVVALLVFGPKRLPEIMRKLGGAVREMRRAAETLKTGLEDEVGEVLGPLDQARREITSALDPTAPAPDRAADDPAPQDDAGHQEGGA
jgi:Tat protein translocase TatB subunit